MTDSKRCPGEELCTFGFNEAAGTIDERREQVCGTCQFRDSKWLTLSPGTSAEAEDIFLEVKRLAELVECGISVDWSKKEFEYFELFQMWKFTKEAIQNSRQRQPIL